MQAPHIATDRIYTLCTRRCTSCAYVSSGLYSPSYHCSQLTTAHLYWSKGVNRHKPATDLLPAYVLVRHKRSGVWINYMKLLPQWLLLNRWIYNPVIVKTKCLELCSLLRMMDGLYIIIYIHRFQALSIATHASENTCETLYMQLPWSWTKVTMTNCWNTNVQRHTDNW